jgi:lipopolysaccharide exporter
MTDRPRSSSAPRAEEAQPLSARVRKGAAWSLATSLLLRLASVLTTAVIAHILNRLDFGVFAIAMTVNGIVTAIGEFGMGSCLIRADLDLDSLAPTMVTFSLVTNTIQAGAMALFAGPIADALGSGRAADSIRILALGMFITSIFSVPNCQLVREFKQNRVFLAQAVAFVPSTVVLFLLAARGNGATAFAWSMVAGQLAYGCVVIFSVHKFYLPGLARGALSVLVRFGLPLGGANIVNYVLLNVDYALLGHLLGAVALGTYVLAFNVASWPASLLGNMVNNVSMPAFSRVKSDAELLRSTTVNALRSLSLAVFPISALTLVLARPIIVTLYGARWTSAAEVLSILTIYGAVSIGCVLFANVLAGLGLSRFLFLVQVVWLGALVPAMIIGVHRGGIAGAAVAHIAVIGPIVLPCYLFVLKRATGVRLTALARAVLPALLASAAAALAAFAVASQLASPLAQLTAGLAAGGLLYAFLTAPAAMEVLSRRRVTSPRLRRILRVYRTAAVLVGLATGEARHARKAGTGRPRRPEGAAAPVRPVPAHSAPARSAATNLAVANSAVTNSAADRSAADPGPPPLSADAVRSTARALDLLISLGRPELPVPALAREANQEPVPEHSAP